MPAESSTAGDVRLAELLAVLSLGADLGMGQPMEHAMRQCVIGLRIGEIPHMARQLGAEAVERIADSEQGADREHILDDVGRTDPGKHLISLLSIPRDLRVPIAGHGDEKINSAFAYGKAPLLIRTIDHLTGFHVNHIVLVDFKGFISLINSMGGVTIDNPTRVDSSQKFGGKLWHFPKGTITLNIEQSSP